MQSLAKLLAPKPYLAQHRSDGNGPVYRQCNVCLKLPRNHTKHPEHTKQLLPFWTPPWRAHAAPALVDGSSPLPFTLARRVLGGALCRKTRTASLPTLDYKTMTVTSLREYSTGQPSDGVCRSSDLQWNMGETWDTRGRLRGPWPSGFRVSPQHVFLTSRVEGDLLPCLSW